MTNTKDLRSTGTTIDDRIEAVVANLRKIAMDDLGFAANGTRADQEIEATINRVRVRYEARCTMGEARIVLYVTKPGVALRTREIRVSGRESVLAETERCRKELLNIVRRVTAVKP